MPLAIKVENLSKMYQLGEISTGTISLDLERWYARIRGKEDPFLRIGEYNDRSKKGQSDFIWSLKDINFEIEQGESIGIIGRNGAGKSTLLKILSRITSPTTGRIRGNGRLASLLEVGTGFNQELTGRENIFLNGAILGMRKKEISARFDEIVDFAGVERYIDTPVKRYSSGMYVRLAFAVAAHLESEILIVDEVLAVGDAEFQKKCLGKMGDMNKGTGRTVLFVSHNMGSILDLCKKCMLLENGNLIDFGDCSDIVSQYVKTTGSEIYTSPVNPQKEIQLIKAEIHNEPNSNEALIMHDIFSIIERRLAIDFRINDNLNNAVGFASVGTFNFNKMPVFSKGSNKFTISVTTEFLATGNYSINIDLSDPNIQYFDRIENCLHFEIIRNTESPLHSHLIQQWNCGSYNIPAKLIDNN